MTNRLKFRLCGGTFYVLFLTARKQRANARARYAGESDGIADGSVLADLITALYPAYQAPMNSSWRSIVSRYKACTAPKQKTMYIPFLEIECKRTIEHRMANDYPSALNSMCDVVEHYIDSIEIKKNEDLIKALVHLIDVDDSIDDKQLFYVCEDGSALTKEALIRSSEFCFQSFLLGVWWFAATREEGNTIGEQTIQQWNPENESSNWMYENFLDLFEDYEIKLHYCTLQQECIQNPTVEEPVIIEPDSSSNRGAADQNRQGFQQPPFPFNFNFGQVIFNQNGANGTQIYYADKVYAGGKNEETK